MEIDYFRRTCSTNTLRARCVIAAVHYGNRPGAGAEPGLGEEFPASRSASSRGGRLQTKAKQRGPVR
jgi:hypothetical protein